jgi:fluoroquinolone transport system permease protein
MTRSAAAAATRHGARLAVTAELARTGALRRAIRWEPAVAGCVIAALVVVWRQGEVPAAALLRVASLIVLLGLAFVLDDPAARLLDAVPTPWRYRFGLRVIVASGIAAGAFAAACGVVRPDLRGGVGVALEAATTLGIGLLAAVAALRYWGVAEPGVAAGPVIVGFVVMLNALPSSWAMFSDTGPQWAGAHLRWTAMLVVAVVLLVGASSDPARRRRGHRCSQVTR